MSKTSVSAQVLLALAWRIFACPIRRPVLALGVSILHFPLLRVSMGTSCRAGQSVTMFASLRHARDWMPIGTARHCAVC